MNKTHKTRGGRLWSATAALLIACLLCGGCAAPTEHAESSEVSAVSEASSTAETSSAGESKRATSTALPYCASDSLSPYAATTEVNRRLAMLLYEGLTRVNAAWDAEPALAASVQVTDETHLTATLRKGAKFSDGSAVTAADVVASFALARRSEAYASLVAEIDSAKADGARIVFTCAHAEALPQTALSFPVIKTAKGGAVLGSGAYAVKSDKKSKKTFLEASATAAVTASVKRRELADVSRRTDWQYALESGTIGCYFTDLSGGDVPRTVTNVTVTPVTLNYLFFLGFNTGRATFSSASMRVAVSQALSRAAICSAGLSGYAVPAVTPFVPTWSGAAKLPGFSEQDDRAAAVSKWQEAGYNRADSGGKTVKNRLSAELLALKDNALHAAAAKEIAKELKAAGMTVQLKLLSYDDYTARLRSGQYDFYLGEVRLPATLRPDALLAGGAASYGVPSSARALYAQFCGGKISAETFCREFVKTAPFLPIAWQQGLLLSAPGTSASPIGADPYAGLTERNE